MQYEFKIIAFTNETQFSIDLATECNKYGFSLEFLDNIEDIEKKYKSPQGIYRPVNFNKNSYGPVSLRNSLGNSLNQTAVSLLNKISYSSFCY